MTSKHLKNSCCELCGRIVVWRTDGARPRVQRAHFPLMGEDGSILGRDDRGGGIRVERIRRQSRCLGSGSER